MADQPAPGILKSADQFTFRVQTGGAARRGNSLSHFKIGDRVEIVGEITNLSLPKVGVITAAGKACLRSKFTVRLADGTESDFWDSQLHIPPIIFADMIFDTHVSPLPSGARGSMFKRHLRFISREFDIHMMFIESEKQKRLYGQLTANGVAPESSLITLLSNGEPYATTAASSCGEFEVNQIPFASAALEILIPSRRIVVTFDVSPH